MSDIKRRIAEIEEELEGYSETIAHIELLNDEKETLERSAMLLDLDGDLHMVKSTDIVECEYYAVCVGFPGHRVETFLFPDEAAAKSYLKDLHASMMFAEHEYEQWYTGMAESPAPVSDLIVDLMREHSDSSGFSILSYKYVASILGISRSSAWSRIKSLTEEGRLSVVGKSGGVNVYKVIEGDEGE